MQKLKGSSMTKPVLIRKPAKTGKTSSKTKTVTLEYLDVSAQMVSVAGTFNNWHPRSLPMIPFGHGRWMKELSLAPGVHEYLFVVDGKWIPDPQARESVLNAFGGVNSVLTI